MQVNVFEGRILEILRFPVAIKILENNLAITQMIKVFFLLFGRI